MQFKLAYPKKSHRKLVFLPELSRELAHFMGILAGDGGINNSWQIVITLDTLTDSEYIQYVRGLILFLFRIEAQVRIRTTCRATDLVLSSTSIVEYLLQLGAVSKNKILNDKGIPDWIKINEEYLKQYIKGLFDTDGSIYADYKSRESKQYFYKYITFTNYGQKTLADLYVNLVKFGFSPTNPYRGRITLRKQSEVDRFFSVIGSSNNKHWTRYFTLGGVPKWS